MAIFIALFFQVLFVFFAMAINVGLVIHDKINLQNAVDLAAYYGAAKQAEILNQIAHVNFQMRQNYKLFTWRYRVLGGVGNRFNPYNVANSTNSILSESPIGNNLRPTVCVSDSFWQEFVNLEGDATVCDDPDLTIPNIIPASGGGNIVPYYSNLVSFTEMANQQLLIQCYESGIFNWLFAARILTHFRVDGLVRKNIVRRLSNNLSSPEFQDLRGESVREGVRNTFELNLTEANRAGITDFRYFNSMSEGQCSDSQFWLPEVRINPVLMFTDFRPTGPNNFCEPENVPNRPVPGRTPGPGGLTNLPNGLNQPQFVSTFVAPNQLLIDHWSGEPSESTGLHSSIGFEKNPWCMVYSGVTATTSVRKPFSPTGGTVTLTARGFAKPFGGRIGPWYGQIWPQGSPNSQATSRNEMVDSLLPSRDVSGSPMASAANEDIANHSRFPGDTFGYNSLRTLSAMITNFRNDITNQISGNSAPMAWGNYNHLGGRPSLEQTGDSLARRADIPNPSGGSQTNDAPQRRFEVAAVAPDPFDALYYSIEPSYFYNYFSEQSSNNGALFSNNEKIYDFGSSKDEGHPGAVPQFHVRKQVEEAVNTYANGYEYYIRDWRNLLTSWHQRGAVDFSMDPERFGRCEVEVANPNLPTPGNCIQGGRTGYSVKNVSRDYLQSGDHAVGGGASGLSGPILNPPTF